MRIVAPIILVVGIYSSQGLVLDLIERVTGLSPVNRFILLYSTSGMRLCCGLVLGAVMLAALVACSRISNPDRRAISATAFSCLVLAGAGLLLGGWRLALVGMALVPLVLVAGMRAARWSALLADRRLGPVLRAGMWGGIGIAEALVPRLYALWLLDRLGRSELAWGERETTIGRYSIACLSAGLGMALLFPFAPMAHLGGKAFADPRVSIIYGPGYTMFSPFDITSIAFDAAAEQLVMCGNGTSTVRVLDLRSSFTSADTGIATGKNQFCAFDGQTRRLMAFDKKSSRLGIFDPASHAEIAAVSLPAFSPGEVFVSYNRTANAQVLASEASVRNQAVKSIRVVDLDSMRLLREIDRDPGYMTTHPTLPIIYTNDFWRTNEMRAYDLETGRELARAVAPARSDRTIVDMRRGHLLVALPSQSRIAIYDARSLALLGSIDAVYGVRSLAIDERRDLLLASSLLDNQLAVIDLGRRRILRRYRLGPWLRDIALDSRGGVAYVSSRFGVYAVRYLEARN